MQTCVLCKPGKWFYCSLCLFISFILRQPASNIYIKSTIFLFTYMLLLRSQDDCFRSYGTHIRLPQPQMPYTKIVVDTREPMHLF